MGINCIQCGKKVEGEGMAFCPYCGAKLPEAADAGEVRDAEAEKWVQKALGVTSYPDRKKILLQGLNACPDSREIQWELLFIGDEGPKKKRTFALDFSIIKSYILEIYRTPKDFSEERRDRMRAQLFDDPRIAECCARFDEPERKQREYIQRLCREYIQIFLEGNNQVMGNWFGLRLERNMDKKLAVPVADMIRRMKKDEKLTPDHREQLVQAMVMAYAARFGGNTEHLDALIES